MLRNLNESSGGRRVLGTPNVGLLAAQIVAETATGDNGAGLLYNEALANSGKQLRLLVTSLPASGTLFVYENGSLELTGAADGSYTLGYQYFVDNVLGGSDTATITVGATNASALAGTGTSTGTGTGGTADAGVSAEALAGTGTSTGSGAGGTATGTAAGAVVASGGTGTSTGTGTGGTATASVAAVAPAGTGTSIGSGAGGKARGNNGLAPTVFVKEAGAYAQVSGVYVKQAGTYQQANVLVKQAGAWIQL